ncbi:hypothetical protein K5X82_14715 [Halosquirtibacter xylanolyticus]|uniref:hypothetical protein n=1 Tax=Halosquirtibacter xylanolyticus TaxID=3374599 RepID=UPI003748228A|nr:hypothetical protein K5X82_14715 [Prolixibacteraceae bacterium]
MKKIALLTTLLFAGLFSCQKEVMIDAQKLPSQFLGAYQLVDMISDSPIDFNGNGKHNKYLLKQYETGDKMGPVRFIQAGHLSYISGEFPTIEIEIPRNIEYKVSEHKTIVHFNYRNNWTARYCVEKTPNEGYRILTSSSGPIQEQLNIGSGDIGNIVIHNHIMTANALIDCYDHMDKKVKKLNVQCTFLWQAKGKEEALEIAIKTPIYKH